MSKKKQKTKYCWRCWLIWWMYVRFVRIFSSNLCFNFIRV